MRHQTKWRLFQLVVYSLVLISGIANLTVFFIAVL
jgi:hypothetical protein